jgi:hypothetical protein
MKTVKIQNTVNSADMLTLRIYHSATSAAGGTLLTSSVSQSGVFTGEDLYKGLEFQVEDNVSDFFVENETLCTNIGSGSLSESTAAVEFHSFYPGDYGSISVVGTVTSTFSVNTTVRQNFTTHPTLTATVSTNYPYEFAGWWTTGQFIGAPQSLANPITIYSGSRHAYVTGSSQINQVNSTKQWYARYRIGSDYY